MRNFIAFVIICFSMLSCGSNMDTYELKTRFCDGSVKNVRMYHPHTDYANAIQAFSRRSNDTLVCATYLILHQDSRVDTLGLFER